MSDRTYSVRLEAAIVGFEKADAAAKSVQNLGDTAKRTASEVEKSNDRQRRSLATYMQQHEQAFRGMEGLGKSMTQAVTVPIAAMGTAVAVTGVAYNSLEQRSRAALTTLLGSARAAADQMERLREFTSGSPFPRQAFIEAQQTLLGFGLEAEKVVPVLGAVQDAVAAIGGTGEDISGIVDVFARIEGQGRITGVELQRLGIRGIDAAAMIGDAMGMTANEIRDQITAGAIDADTAIDALVIGINDKMGGAAENMRHTWAGATDRVKAAFRDLSSAMVEPFISIEGGGIAVEGANRIADSLRAVESAYRDLPAAGQVAVTGVATFAAGVGPALWAVGRFGQAILNTKTNLRNAKPLLSGFGRFLTGPWGIAITGATAAVGLFAKAKYDAAMRVNQLTDAIVADSGALGENTRELVVNRLEQEGVLEAAQKLGIGLDVVTDAALGQAGAQRAVADAVQAVRDENAAYMDSGEAMGRSLAENADLTATLEGGLGRLTSEMEESLAAAERQAEAVDGAGAAAAGAEGDIDSLGGEFGELGLEIDGATSALERYQDTLRAVTDPVFALVRALDAVEDAQQTYTDAVKEHGEGSAEAERASIDLARAIRDAELAALDGDLAYDEFTAQLDRWVDQGVMTADQAEIIKSRVDEAREAAEEYEGGYMAELRMDVGQALGALDEFMEKLTEAGFSRGDAAWAARYQAQANATFPDVPDPMGDGPGRGGRALDNVRQAMRGLPGLRITSTYRTPAHNARVGGSPTSYHMDRNNPAVDVAGPMSSLDRLYQRLHGTGRELIWRAPGHYDHLHYANRGGPLPGYGTRDTVPAMLTPGEYVINADAVRRYGHGIFDLLNAQRLNAGGPVGYDTGALFAMTRGASFGTPDEHLRAIDRMQQAYEDMTSAIEAAEQSKRRQEILDRRAAAETAEERKRAQDDLAKFDRDARLAADRREIEARIQAARTNQQIAANREQFRFDRMSTDQQIADLDRRLAAERAYTDSWMQLARQRQQLLDAQASDATRSYEQELAALNRMLDQRTQAIERHETTVAQLRSRAAEAEAQAIERRANQLRNTLALDLTDAWAHSATSIAQQLEQQQTDLTAWAGALTEARARGLSTDAIELLGLDQGPEALGQLQVLLRSSDAELAALSTTVADRNATLARQVESEMGDAHAALGRELADIRNTLDDDLREAGEELEEALAEIGHDAGRSFAAAVREGLASGLPTIVAQVTATQRAMQAASAAEAQAAATAPSLEQQVRGIFSDVGVSLAFGAESASQRLARIVASIRAGERTVADIRRSAELQRAQHPATRLHTGGYINLPRTEERLAVLRGQEVVQDVREVVSAGPQIVVVEKVIERETIPSGKISLVLPDGQQVDAYFDGRIAHHEDAKRRTRRAAVRGGRS